MTTPDGCGRLACVVEPGPGEGPCRCGFEALQLGCVARRTERDNLRVAKDGAYAERNQCVALLARMALALGWRAWVAQHPAEDADWEADWRTIVFIELPSGQASWHFHDSERHLLEGLPAGPNSWDGHTTAEKYRRVRTAHVAGCPALAQEDGNGTAD